MADGGTHTTQAGRLKPGSQNGRIVAALDGNGWMTTAQIHRAAGFSRLNSRVSELREYGYVIPSRHVEGKVGPHGTEYMLVATPDEAALDQGLTPKRPRVPAASSGTAADAALDEPTSELAVPAQLTLEVAA